MAPETCSRYFCGSCGAHVALVTAHSPDSIDVTVATLDHPERVPANRHIWGIVLPLLALSPCTRAAATPRPPCATPEGARPPA
ncbi:hypothetical protein WR25_10393 [Diploscapter pachys]|uniref:CENP-V/GFA domain-containing protein n=1 Tax=Diploscapter pachys TaxID=2018661 RepID=A0A2A2M5E9_9BILA|nr:hypothetical protein WR25_10393 [Diploscapter pachys]